MNTYNPYPSIKLDFGKNNKWFYLLFEAILRVDSSYIEYEMIDVDSSNAPKAIGAREHLERVFAYELYRQWANLLEERGIKNLVINGEIGKCLKDDIVLDQSNSNINRKKDVFPDLVLHHSHEDDNNQLMICEIKREKGLDGAAIFDDLYKISCYLDKEIFWKKPFEYGAFIIVGKNATLNKIKINEGTLTSFKNNSITIEEYKKNKDFKRKFNHIVCISYDGVIIEYNTLDKLLKTIITKPKRNNSRNSKL